jgi:hypothetical protein
MALNLKDLPAKLKGLFGGSGASGSDSGGRRQVVIPI